MRHALLITLAAAVMGCVAPSPPQTPGDAIAGPAVRPASSLLPSPIPWSGTTRAFADEQAAADLIVDALTERVQGAPEVWIYREQLASALLTRARLTGEYEDYAAAREQLDLALLEPNARPWSTVASLRFSLHQLDGLHEVIDRIEGGWPASDHREAEVAGRRGNIDLLSGEYTASRESLQRAVDLNDTAGALASFAVWHWRTGDFAHAEALFVAASQRYHAPAAEPRAWFHLNLGLLDLDRGRWSEALSHYRDAERELSGSWLVEEHIAEVLVLLGERDRAETIYRDVIARTDGPEFMDALAGLLVDRDPAESAYWLGEARTRWESALDRFPEAAYGHALGHYLDAGDAPERALELATANHEIRPGGDSKVLLAQALAGVDELDAARAVIEDALASLYDSADLHAVAAAIYEALGETDLAEAQRVAALAMNPAVLD